MYLKEAFMRILNKLFSIKQSEDYSRTVLTILGLKLKIRTLDIILKDFFHNLVAQEIYSSYEVYDLHSKVFPKYKNINSGKSMAVFGCGPTLKFYNNELDTINLALNKALFLENIEFDYSFALDANICDTCPGYLEKIKEIDCIKFLGRALSCQVPQFPEIVDEEKYKIERFYSSNRKKMYAFDFGKNFHSRLECYPLLDVHTVAFSALQFALYTHPKNFI